MTRNNTPMLMKVGAGVVFCALIAGYGLWQSRVFLQGPVLTIESPVDGAIVSDMRTTLTGTAENVSYISLNGRQIYTDPEGNINESLLLPEGYNIIQIRGEDKFGRSVTETISLVTRNTDTSPGIVQEPRINTTN